MDMVATKIWFNPHNIVPQLGPDNVIELKLQLRLRDVTPFHSMNLKNLERLHINWDHGKYLCICKLSLCTIIIIYMPYFCEQCS